MQATGSNAGTDSQIQMSVVRCKSDVDELLKKFREGALSSDEPVVLDTRWVLGWMQG